MCHLLDLGFNIAFDTIVKQLIYDAERRAENLKDLVDIRVFKTNCSFARYFNKILFSKSGKMTVYTTVLKDLYQDYWN